MVLRHILANTSLNADMWCDSINATDYCSFLETLLNAVAVEGEDGELVFRDQKRSC